MRRRILLGTLAVAAVTLIVGVGAAGLIRQALVDRAEAELFRQAEVTALLIEREVESLFASDRDRGQIARILEQTRLIGGHDFLEAAVISPARVEPLIGDPKLLPVVPLDATRRVVTVDIDGERVIATVRIIDVTDRFRLAVAIGRTEAFLGLTALTRPFLVALLVGGLLAVVLAFGLSRTLGRRLDGLAAAARRLADGDFDTRVEVTGDDDLRAVATAFNAMADRLEAARRRERDFLMSVGHDLRTPLTTIRGYAEALDAGTIDGDDLRRIGGILHRQTDRLSRLVEDLMMLSRLEAREFTLAPESVDLAAHLAEVVEAHRVRADALDVELQITFDQVGVVVADPDRVAQILANLLDNAFRYAPEGGTVSVTLQRTPEGVELAVADNGPGIDPQDIPHVFERLYVAQRYRPVRPEGSGLGLSIVRELVDAMGGDAEVESTLGSGTTVRVGLPAPVAAPVRV